MTTVVISQPMFFPWVGMLEQLEAADVYVHYDDVQFSKGSFCNRVQIKTATGIKWLTVPLEDAHLGQHIRDVRVDSRRNWRRSHVDQLKQAYKGAREMLELVERVYAVNTPWLCEVAVSSMTALADVFGVSPACEAYSSELGIAGHGTERVLAIVKSFGGTRYVSGAGGRAYLDHAAFARAGVSVEYMQYAKREYPQAHGAFTPYVSALDLLANVGRSGKSLFTSTQEPVTCTT